MNLISATDQRDGMMAGRKRTVFMLRPDERRVVMVRLRPSLLYTAVEIVVGSAAFNLPISGGSGGRTGQRYCCGTRTRAGPARAQRRLVLSNVHRQFALYRLQLLAASLPPTDPQGCCAFNILPPYTVSSFCDRVMLCRITSDVSSARFAELRAPDHLLSRSTCNISSSRLR